MVGICNSRDDFGVDSIADSKLSVYPGGYCQSGKKSQDGVVFLDFCQGFSAGRILLLKYEKRPVYRTILCLMLLFW